MMKRIALFLAAAACLLAGCSRTQKFTFQGDFDSARITVAADSLLLQSDGLPVPVVGAEGGAEPGQPFQLDGKPAPCRLSFT